jgi:hypothetical protein
MSQETMIKRVGMLILRQPSIANAIDFYTKLGLKLKFHLKDSWAELVLGDLKIGLCPTSAPQEYRTGIVLEVSDLHAFYKAHKGMITFLGEPKEAVHGIMVSFKDPGGNILDVYQPTPERVKELIKRSGNEDDSTPCKNDQASCCKKTEKMAHEVTIKKGCRSGCTEA